MDDLSRIRYLVGTGANQKLKRNVPKHLVALAGKTAWVKRIAHIDRKTAKQKSHIFAVETDAELSKLQAAFEGKGGLSEHDDDLILDATQAERIALAYFQDRNRKNVESGAYFLSPDDPEYDDLLVTAYGDVLAAVKEAAGEYRTTDPRAVDLLAEYGVISETGAQALNGSGWPEKLANHQPFQAFCRMIERADLQLANLRYRSWKSAGASIIDYGHLPSMESPWPQTRARPGATKTIAELKAAFLTLHASRVTPSRAAQYRIPFRALEERLGSNRDIASITREEVRQVANFLPRIPAYVSQHFPGLALADAAEQFENTNGRSTARWSEAQKHLQVIKLAFAFAVDEQWLATDPSLGVTIAAPADQRKKHLSKSQTYEPFSIAELNRIFSLPLYTGCLDDENGCNKPGDNVIRRHRFWAPIIALWTGMRMNEILQLEKDDFKKTDTGTPYVQVTDEDRGAYVNEVFQKRVKSKNAIRDIPIHPVLERIGLMSWIEGRQPGRLFPEAAVGAGEKPSDLYSKRFRSNLKAAKINKPRRLVFHSFRNNFNDALREAGAPEEIRKLINGWQEQRSMDQRYGRGPKIERLREHMVLVEYPGLQIEHLFTDGCRSI